MSHNSKGSKLENIEPVRALAHFEGLLIGLVDTFMTRSI